jgi:DNA-binding beta-propeller fold protein YncE
MKRMLTLAALLAGATFLVSQTSPPERVGPLAGGGFLLNSGWVLRPAGAQIPLSTLPMSVAVAPGGKYVLILHGGYLKPSISVHEAAGFRTVATVEVPDAWLGLAFAPGTSRFYAGGGAKGCVYEFELTPAGQIEARRTFALIPQDKLTHRDFIGDVAVSTDGRILYAAGFLRDSIFAVNLASGMVTDEWKTVARPYRILMHPGGGAFYVTGMGAGQIALHNAVSGALVARQFAEMEPMDLVWSTRQPEQAGGEEGADNAATKKDAGEAAPPYAGRIFSASGATNLVSVFGVKRDGPLEAIERINVALTPLQPAGSTPSALALAPDERTLYVVCSDLNAVAVVDISTAHATLRGFIPTGWYPTAARVLSDGRVLVLNGRGARSFANPRGPNPLVRAEKSHLGEPGGVEYVGAIQRGTASLIAPYSDDQLSAWTRTVLANSPYRDERMMDAGIPVGNPIPSVPGAATPLQHVVYIIKENRTYDQVLGDLGRGNGDASLAIFGQQVTPNLHKLARDFVTLDNFYVNADVSADGHNWTSSAIAPPYVQRLWPNSYAGRRAHYDYEHMERAALPPAGRLWTNALMAGLSLRDFGWGVDNITPAPSSGRQVSRARDPQLAPCVNLDYRGFDLEYRDVDRERVFEAELRQWESSGQMPRLTLVRLGNDHTAGVAAGRPSPRALVADNDLAIGRLVDALSHSRFWATSAIFIVEDDAQNGADHVDSHRSPAFVLSPYTRHRGVDSTMYNTVSVLRTMELILGLRPMTVFDAGARPMWNAFAAQPDLTPYNAVEATYPLHERNPAADTAEARLSAGYDYSEADQIDDNAFNAVLWRAIRGTPPPAPVRSLFGR